MSPTGSGGVGEALADGVPSDPPPPAGWSTTDMPDGSVPPTGALRVATIEEGCGEEGVRLPSGMEEEDQTGPELMEAWKSEMVSQSGGWGGEAGRVRW